MLRVVIAVLLVCLSPVAIAADKYDVLIRGGKIVDGTGAPWYYGDVAIRQGRIVKLGRIPSDATADKTIDAAGLIVAPGFIDMMGQTATPMLRSTDSALNLLSQGITTINAGEGSSAAPLSEKDAASEGWSTMTEHFQLADIKGLPVNVVQTVGHTQVRRIVLGDVDRRPSPDELKKMQALVEEAMQAGAIGVSTALIYPPATYASIEEIAALSEVAGKYGGRYYTHMRNEGDRLLDAIDEAIEIGRLAKTPVHIFHLKAAGQQNWGKMAEAIAKIKAARAAGQQVAADVYPYINNGLNIQAFIHPRHSAEGRAKLIAKIDNEDFRKEVKNEMETVGGWENWFRHTGQNWDKVVVGKTSDKEFRDSPGTTIHALAEKFKKDPWDVFFQLCKADTFVLPQTMAEANVSRAMREEFVSFCTDVGPDDNSGSAAHPRAYGAFPRLFARYVREWGVISLERAVAQASAVAANEVLAYDRGRIAEGLAADVVVFDEARFSDNATFAEPHKVADGMKFVLVNGVTVFEGAKLTGKKPGRILRGPGYDVTKAPFNYSTGKTEKVAEAYDRIFQKFMRDHHVPGGAMTIIDRGKIVAQRGYGFADIVAREQVQPDSLFRIASISKPITAIAILQLVEQGKLKLDQPIVPLLKEKTFLEGDAKPDERTAKITIRDCLQHTGGWDRGKSFDAMFKQTEFAKLLGKDAPAGQSEIIQVMLGKPLDLDPGTKYAYSNLGYCILGRIMENITGEAYEPYTKKHVLEPLGITRMRIGGTFLKDRLPGEVRYYDPGVSPSVYQATLGQQVPSTYGAWSLEALDSHGGWVASATDLATIAAAFDNPEHCKLLKADTIHQMFAKPEKVVFEGPDKTLYYGLGWQGRTTPGGTLLYQHGGSLPGTATSMVHRTDGLSWAIVFNARLSPTAAHLGNALNELLHETADKLRKGELQSAGE
ncbi:MAG TPA: serine hydrolase [Caulifigura sp.]|nr:serine hydrolase [Caulifigura sp.]